MTGKYRVAIAVCLLAAGCGERPPEETGAGGATEPPSLTGTDWTLMTLDGETVAPLSDGRRPGLRFEAGRVHGFAGCNRLTGGYRSEGAEIGFSQLAMTRMACPEGMDIEQRFSGALERTTRYNVEEDRLILRDANAEIVAVLQSTVPQPR